MRRGLDWAGMLRAGLGGLRLHPDNFWTLTPAELLLMLGVDNGSMPMARSHLEALLQRFSDQDGGG